MTQIQFALFFFGLPMVCGLILGVIAWKSKKTYWLTGILLCVCVIWWCVLSNINLHGNEGPGLLCLLYTNFVFACLLMELIKFMMGRIGKKERIQHEQK